MTSEFLGARASNTGDDYHELWAARHAVRLLSSEEDLQGLTVEGVAAQDDAAVDGGAWDGVDCALYFGGVDCRSASRVVIEQLKYSAASPLSPWTTARIAYGRPERSVIGRLARAWRSAKSLAAQCTPIDVVLVSNQPVDPKLVACVGLLATMPSGSRLKEGSDAKRIATSSGLDRRELAEFCHALRFEAGAGSRFAAEERVIAAVASWTESDILHGVMRLREFVRSRMRPEHAGQVITRRSVLLHFGAHAHVVLLPCPPELAHIESPIRRRSATIVSEALRDGVQFIAIHGRGGIGKTTALQEVEAELPQDSVMVVYDCYGGGTYQDPSTLRHRPEDAYMQLVNQLAIRLEIPLILSRSVGDDLPRLFRRRLHHAAEALEARQPGALLIIAIDAADNAILAAEVRAPREHAFVLDFVRIESLPKNVRFIVSARTGRLDSLDLPGTYRRIEIEAFDRGQTAEFVRRRATATDSWLDDFHHLSGGVPRVQSYALKGCEEYLDTALNRLRPTGKQLDDVFLSQLNEARRKSGDRTLRSLCSGLMALARPIPISAMAEVTGVNAAQVLDACSDLAPGLRIGNGLVSFADEDFEDFMRREAADGLQNVRDASAAWMLARCGADPYAAMHVAEALTAANRGGDLLELVEREAAPAVIPDPVMRREVEVQRLRLAIKVCRAAGDTRRAFRFVLTGADGLKTEAALRDLLAEHPDMAAAFAHETGSRLLLARQEEIGRHGGFLFHRLAVDAHRGDGIAVREGNRRLRAWLDARAIELRSGRNKFSRTWSIDAEQIASSIEATLLVRGADAALEELQRWSPWTVALEVALTLPTRLISAGRADLVQAVCGSAKIGRVGRLLCSVPLALSGMAVPSHVLVDGLHALWRRRLHVRQFFERHRGDESIHGRLLRAAVTAAELLVSRGERCEAANLLVQAIAAPNHRRIDRRYSSEAERLDLLLRCYTLQETLEGRVPVRTSFFEPRPTEADDKSTRRGRAREHDHRHDQELTEALQGVFDLYAARALALVKTAPRDIVDAALTKAISSIASTERWMSRRHDSAPLRDAAAVSLLSLLGTEFSADTLKKHADSAHGKWGTSGAVPTEDYITTLALRSDLHTDLARDLTRAAATARTARISASEKCSRLVKVARLLRPISPDDAQAVFNHAIEAAAHIDVEAMSQIKLIDRLIKTGHGQFKSSAGVSRDVAVIIADACVRLDGYDGFPWDAAMSALGRLDGPRALADVVRWDDEGIARLDDMLPELLKAGIEQGWLPLTHAASLACLARGDEGVLDAAVERAIRSGSSDTVALVEAAASDSLIRHQHRGDSRLRRLVDGVKLTGPWCSAFLKQESLLDEMPQQPSQSSRDSGSQRPEPQSTPPRNWLLSELTGADRLREAVLALQAERLALEQYVGVLELLGDARKAVPVRHRVEHLEALAAIAAGEAEGRSGEWSRAATDAAQAWRQESPSVDQWCRDRLPAVLTKHLIDFIGYPSQGDDKLASVLSMTGLQPPQLAELVLAGMEAHVNRLNASRIFELAVVAAGLLTPSEAADLATWYADRLATRVPEGDRHAAPVDADYPADLDTATSQMLFAVMGDCDVRMRWRAAHAARRLASLRCVKTLRALLSTYELRTVVAFRSKQLPFYWLAARLWFVLAWQRIVNDDPATGVIAGEALLGIALNDAFPHLLVRAIARDACLALSASGWTPSVSDLARELDRVNAPQVAPAKRQEPRGQPRRPLEFEAPGRFRFDSIDTVPYWYEPMLRGFAAVSMQRFTSEAERWILDVWGYPNSLWAWDQEARRHQLERYDWSLTGHRHGSLPKVERLSTHLEWHAMWCAVGELLKTEPLAITEREWDTWDSLEDRVSSNLLTEAPIWSADLLCPTPLVLANWTVANSPIDEWVQAVTEKNHRAELLPVDRSDYVVVEGDAERWSSDRVESISISSAMATCGVSASLVRALQTMESAWDYKLPDEGEDAEIDALPFRMTGWLKRRQADGALDRMDEFRGAALQIVARPGRAVIEACTLVRGGSSGEKWTNASLGGAAPMFVHEVWGRDVRDNDRYNPQTVVFGHRLLAHREQLQRFLSERGVDLVVEVEVNRRDRTDRQLVGEEEEQEGKFDRLYRLCADGELAVAEGSLGAWRDDRQ